MGWLSRFRSWRRSFRRRIRRYIYRARRRYRRYRRTYRRFSIRRIFRRARRVIGNVHRKISHKGSRIIRRLTVWRRGKTITSKTKSWFRRVARWIRRRTTSFRKIKKVWSEKPIKIFRGLSTRIRRRISWLTRKIRGRNLVNRAKTALRKIGKIIALPAIALGGLLAKKKLEEKRIEKREEKPPVIKPPVEPYQPPIIKPEEIPQEILQDPAQFVKNTMADFQEVLQEPAKITKKPRVLVAIALFALVAFYFWRKKK